MERPEIDWDDTDAFTAEPDPVVHGVHYLVAGNEVSFSAEHGVGVLKRDELQKYGSPAAVGLMRTLKDALDPNGIMTPGKVLG